MLQRVRVPVVVAWLAAAPFALWAIGRVLGVDGFAPAAQLMAFTPYVAAVAVVPVILALLGRRWWVAGVAAATCVTLAVCVQPRAFGSPSTMDGVAVTVMSMNMREGGADVAAILEVVRQERVDILTVQEFTPSAQERLAAAGLERILPYHVSQPIKSTPGSALYSRYPLSATGSTRNAGGFYQAHGLVTVAGAGVVAVESVHPLAPAQSDYVSLWKQDLRDQKPAPGNGTPRILAGDFNATLDHSELRRLIATGYRDAADTVGKGLTPTWPYYGQRSAVTPKVTIDHILVSGSIGVTDFRAFTIPRTDHRAIVSRLTLAD